MNKEKAIAHIKEVLEFSKELKSNQFDFSTYVTEAHNECGTVCCMLGWYPKWYPNDFKWKKDGWQNSGWAINITYDAHRFLEYTGFTEDLSIILYEPKYRKECTKYYKRFPPLKQPTLKRVRNRWKAVLKMLENES